MKLLILLLLVLMSLPRLACADSVSGDTPHLHLSLRREFLATEAKLTWEGAGTLEQSTNLRSWRPSVGTHGFGTSRARSFTVDLGATSPKQLHFRLRLPEAVDDDHIHLTRDTLYPYIPTQQVELVDPGWQLFRRLPVHRIRIHAIRTADSNGGFPATVTAAQISDMVAQATTIFYRAGVEFLFDPATDLQDIDDTNLNRDVRAPNADSTYTNQNLDPTELGVTSDDGPKRARAAEALRHKGKLVVYFRYQKAGWQWNGTHWIPSRTGSGNSSWASTHVNMPPRESGLNLLAHELGHHLQNMHTFAGEFTRSQAEAEIEEGLANGSVTVDNALEVFNGDAYWVRDTPPDPSQMAFPGGGCSDATVTLNADTDPGSGVAMRAFTAAPDRLNLLSYYGDCVDLGTRRLSADMMDRLRDGLENSIRHPLISQHIDGFFSTNLTREDTYDGSAIGPGLQLLRTRWDQLAAVYTTPSGTLRLMALSLSDAGVLTVQGTHDGGIASDSVAAVNMGLGLVAVSIGSNSAMPQYRIYRVSETGVWQRLSTWISGDGIAGPVTMTRCGRLNFVTGHNGLGTSGNSILRLFETDANGLINLQDQQITRPGSSLSLGVVRGNFLVTAMRGADGNLSINCYKQSGERGANELVLVGGTSAGAIASVDVVACEHDRFVTAVKTGGGAIKLILWEVDFDGNVTRVGNGTDGPDANFLTAGLAGSDIIVTAARTSGGGLSMRLWDVDPAGTFSDSITNNTELSSPDAFDSLGVQLMRDRFIAVARRLSTGAMQIRSYRFSP